MERFSIRLGLILTDWLIRLIVRLEDSRAKL